MGKAVRTIRKIASFLASNGVEGMDMPLLCLFSLICSMLHFCLCSFGVVLMKSMFLQEFYSRMFRMWDALQQARFTATKSKPRLQACSVTSASVRDYPY